MSFQASAKSLRVSPRKVRLVIDQVRGLSVVKAESILLFMNKKSAQYVLKLILSAAANAKSTANVEKENLKITTIFADGGFVMKRFRARAFGRAVTIRKRTSHVTVVLDEVTPKAVEKKADKKPAAKKAAVKKSADTKKQ
jgi:large subunit ribosomal protein L22